jgi:uncharacterized protein (TIGR02145 family)
VAAQSLPGDINSDGCVGVNDILIILGQFGECQAEIACGDSILFDNYYYETVLIGDQCWFAENLRTMVYADGTAIPVISDPLNWSGPTYTGARCHYNFVSANLTTYGRLYNWYAVDDAGGLCPSGWHVPTDGEWTELENYITAQGFAGTEGIALKCTSCWDGNGNGTDDFGFSALPGGRRSWSDGAFGSEGGTGYWWSSSPNGDNAWFRSLLTNYSGISRSSGPIRFGFSVRCLRDAE